ncbi:MAG: PQQ-binding-like beta-propeller repeat protein [Proteobacteria bacterium]|nr:PQQ-binding-like beta-propeller repeat protein [Pseudomonadota bacterium]
MARLIATGALLAAGAAGCAGPRGLHGLAPAPDPAQLRRALAPFGRVEATVAPAQAAAAVWLVARDPVRLAVYDLGRGDFRFIVRADVASRVVVGRGFGAFARDEGRSIAAFDSERGRQLWQQPTPRAGWRALGLAASAELVVVVWGHRGRDDVPPGTARGAPQATIAAYDGRSGERRWALPSWVRVGEPSAWRDQLVLPIQRQGLAVLRARDGQVVAQLPWHGEAIAWTEANRDGVFFGGRSGVHRLGPATTGRAFSAPLAPVAALPAIDGVSPVWGRRAYDGAPWDYGAGDRQRWLWRRPVSPPLSASGWADDRLLLLHYRFLLGFALDQDGPSACAWPGCDAARGPTSWRPRTPAVRSRWSAPTGSWWWSIRSRGSCGSVPSSACPCVAPPSTRRDGPVSRARRRRRAWATCATGCCRRWSIPIDAFRAWRATSSPRWPRARARHRPRPWCA